jgi:hypothetical protein
MSILIDALREKYRSPADALRALGLPTTLLGYDAGPRRRACDEDPEPEAVESAGEESPQLSVEELALVREVLAAYAEAKEKEPEEEGEEGGESEREKYDEFEPDGEDEAHGITAGANRVATPSRVKHTAMDEAQVTFDERYPGLSRVDIRSDGVCYDEGGHRMDASQPRVRRTSAADDERFARMFPNLPRCG